MTAISPPIDPVRYQTALDASRARLQLAEVATATVSTGVTLEYAIHSSARDASSKTAQAPARLVLIMGFSGIKEAWGLMIEHLVQCWTSSDKVAEHQDQPPLEILTLDNRGCGGSDAPWGRYTTTDMARDVLALMDHVGWKTASVAGVSMGGMISLELAAQAPDRVVSLALMSTTRGQYHNPPGAISGLAKMILARDASSMLNRALHMMYPQEFLDSHGTVADAADKESSKTMYEILHDSMMTGFTSDSAKRGSLVGIVGQALATQTHFVSDARLADIARAGFPIFVLAGRCDRIIPVCEAELLREKLTGKHVTTQIYEDAGHGVNDQYPDVAAQTIIEGLKQGSALRAQA